MFCLAYFASELKFPVSSMPGSPAPGRFIRNITFFLFGNSPCLPRDRTWQSSWNGSGSMKTRKEENHSPSKKHLQGMADSDQWRSERSICVSSKAKSLAWSLICDLWRQILFQVVKADRNPKLLQKPSKKTANTRSKDQTKLEPH